MSGLPRWTYGLSMADTHPFLDHDGPIAFAHRGGAGDWPENSLPAFAGAVALGYRYVETDAHATADGVIIAFHDDRLDRVTDRTGLISELEWSEVREARIDGLEPIPLLSDLFTTWPDLRVNIDPKHDEVVEPLADLLHRVDALDRVCIGSFSDRRLERLRAQFGRDLCTSMGPAGVARMRAASFGVGRSTPPGNCMQVPVRTRGVTLVDDRFVRRAHSVGIAVHVWTIDEPGEMVRLLDLGVDGIMTDRPAALRDVLLDRGQWIDP
jgi:glycerophosphoryl diester phosphodiesterase